MRPVKRMSQAGANIENKSVPLFWGESKVVRNVKEARWVVSSPGLFVYILTKTMVRAKGAVFKFSALFIPMGKIFCGSPPRWVPHTPDNISGRWIYFDSQDSTPCRIHGRRWEWMDQFLFHRSDRLSFWLPLVTSLWKFLFILSQFNLIPNAFVKIKSLHLSSGQQGVFCWKRRVGSSSARKNISRRVVFVFWRNPLEFYRLRKVLLCRYNSCLFF